MNKILILIGAIALLMSPVSGQSTKPSLSESIHKDFNPKKVYAMKNLQTGLRIYHRAFGSWPENAVLFREKVESGIDFEQLKNLRFDQLDKSKLKASFETNGRPMSINVKPDQAPLTDLEKEQFSNSDFKIKIE